MQNQKVCLKPYCHRKGNRNQKEGRTHDGGLKVTKLSTYEVEQLAPEHYLGDKMIKRKGTNNKIKVKDIVGVINQCGEETIRRNPKEGMQYTKMG
jgi:hypothetical protein